VDVQTDVEGCDGGSRRSSWIVPRWRNLLWRVWGRMGLLPRLLVTVSVPTTDGVQSVTALGTAVVTDGGKTATELKKELGE